MKMLPLLVAAGRDAAYRKGQGQGGGTRFATLMLLSFSDMPAAEPKEVAWKEGLSHRKVVSIAAPGREDLRQTARVALQADRSCDTRVATSCYLTSWDRSERDCYIKLSSSLGVEWYHRPTRDAVASPIGASRWMPS